MTLYYKRQSSTQNCSDLGPTSTGVCTTFVSLSFEHADKDKGLCRVLASCRGRQSITR